MNKVTFVIAVARSGCGGEREGEGERERARGAGQAGAVAATHSVQVGSSDGDRCARGTGDICRGVNVAGLGVYCPQVGVGNTALTGGTFAAVHQNRSVQCEFHITITRSGSGG